MAKTENSTASTLEYTAHHINQHLHTASIQANTYMAAATTVRCMHQMLASTSAPNSNAENHKPWDTDLVSSSNKFSSPQQTEPIKKRATAHFIPSPSLLPFNFVIWWCRIFFLFCSHYNFLHSFSAVRIFIYLAISNLANQCSSSTMIETLDNTGKKES